MKTEFRKQGYNRCYYHFKERLKNRYDLEITESEYIKLCNNKNYKVISLKNHLNKVIEIGFKNTKIKALLSIRQVRNIGNKELLSTALA